MQQEVELQTVLQEELQEVLQVEVDSCDPSKMSWASGLSVSRFRSDYPESQSRGALQKDCRWQVQQDHVLVLSVCPYQRPLCLVTCSARRGYGQDGRHSSPPRKLGSLPLVPRLHACIPVEVPNGECAKDEISTSSLCT